MSPRDQNKEPVVTDVGTLQKLVESKSACRNPWFEKSLWGFLLANIGLLVTVGWALITDHFAIKALQLDSFQQGQILDRLDVRTASNERAIISHEWKIESLQRKAN